MIALSHPSGILNGEIHLPSSKSISNRMLILQKMYEPTLKLDNISVANDSQLLKRLLQEAEDEVNVEDAGAVYRFMVAYCSVTPGEWKIEGTPRLNKRPISELVNVLRSIGADIKYSTKKNEAPLTIIGKQLVANEPVIDLTEVRSSQFISALLLISPKIDGDFSIRVNPKMLSFSYVLLTVSCIRRMGFSVHLKGSFIQVSKQQKFDGEYFKIEPDWTSFYYWYSMIHLSQKCDLFFPGLRLNNMQKERKLLFEVGSRNVLMEEVNDGLRFSKQGPSGIDSPQKLDFAQFPDSAMTYAILLAAGQGGTRVLTGLESLKYKESEREKGLTEHLRKLGCELIAEKGKWTLRNENFELKPNTLFPTYNDHRMAMCVAPLGLLDKVVIEEPNAVRKSYPHFWDDLESVGFQLEEVPYSKFADQLI